jgi:Holliday junction resolvase RusA-like endonuclease
MWQIRERALAALGDAPPLQGPLCVTVTAWVRQPASIAKRDRLTALPTRRPDVDNFAKTVLDGCAPLWADDAQVVDLVARKRYAVDAAPRWEISVENVATGADAPISSNACHCVGLHGSAAATDDLEVAS